VISLEFDNYLRVCSSIFV